MKQTVTSKYEPKSKNVTWIDMSSGFPVLKNFINGKWRQIGGIPNDVTYDITNIPDTIELKVGKTYNLGKIIKPVAIDNSNLDGEAVIKFNYAYENQFPTLPSNLVWEGSEPVFERFSNIEIHINGNKASAKIYYYDGDDVVINLLGPTGGRQYGYTKLSFYINITLDELKYRCQSALNSVQTYEKGVYTEVDHLDFSKSYIMENTVDKTVVLSGEFLNPKDYPILLDKQYSNCSIGYPVKYSYYIRDIFLNNDGFFKEKDQIKNISGFSKYNAKYNYWSPNILLSAGMYLLFLPFTNSSEHKYIVIDYPSTYHKDILLYNGQNVDLGDLDYTVVVTNKRLKGTATVSFNCVDATKVPTFEGIVSWEDGAPEFSPYYRYVITVNGQYASYVKYPRIVEQELHLVHNSGTSSYHNTGICVNITINELKKQLVEQLGNLLYSITNRTSTGVQVETTYNNGVWSGDSFEIHPLDGVRIRYNGSAIDNEVVIKIKGTAIDKSTATVTLKSNIANWFTYPFEERINMEELFVNPTENDEVSFTNKSDIGDYTEEGWWNDPETIYIEKGDIVKYQSHNSEDVVITFD